MSSLKDDIDLPMQKIIAYLNLLGVKTYWSCCGFDYPEQPAHKAHQEQLNICMKYSVPALNICIEAMAKSPLWRLKIQPVMGDMRALILHLGKHDTDANWGKGTVHYHEIPAQMAFMFEKMLYEKRNDFVDEVTLIDTNHNAKENTPYWTYQGQDSWIIRKADYVQV